MTPLRPLIDFTFNFVLPPPHLITESFTRRYLPMVAPNDEILIYITDWGLYQPSEMLTIQALRAVNGETRNLIDSPAHVISTTERELRVSLFSLAVSYMWKASIYAPRGSTTLYNWEGELVDFWTSEKETYQKLRSLLNEINLNRG